MAFKYEEDSCKYNMTPEVQTQETFAERPVFLLTEKAAEIVRKIAESEGRPGIGLRVTVAPGGCAGYSYGLDFEEHPQPTDVTVDAHGVKVYINEDIVPLIEGAKLDYVESLQGAGFVLDNPNATHSCGCGKSFS
ncbi:MAG: HesB/IscA family protein [Thermoplasmatota archaeon]